jgi:SAM-dependent methyltransferase
MGEHDRQYVDDRKLRARQRLWEKQEPKFDLIGWVLGLAGVTTGRDVLDLGCGNGFYLRRLRERGIVAVGADRSVGMLQAAAPHPARVNADAGRLPFRDHAFDTVLAPHMLYHVPDRTAAAHEIRRVLRPGGVAVAVTNGRDHMRSLRAIVEAAVHRSTPGWEMQSPSSRAFSLENGAEQLGVAFDDVTLVRADAPVAMDFDDASIAADYVDSLGDVYEDEIAAPWSEVVATVRGRVQAMIDADGAFAVRGDTGAFICR